MQSNSRGKLKNRPVSVLEIIGTASKGGMENYMINFIKNLPAENFKLTCICPCESLFTKCLRELGIENVFITPLADNPEWRSIQLAVEVIRLHKVDVLHAHMPKSHVLAGLAGSLTGKPVVATLHGMHVTAHELGVALAVKSHLITNCQETYFQALAMGLPSQRVNLFHNGVDVKAFDPDRAGRKFRDTLRIPMGCALVGFVGRLEHEKGPDLFLRTAARIHELIPEVHFAIVGDGTMTKELKILCAQLGMAENVHFVDWVSNTADVYPALDLVIHTSRNDGTSLVLLEAMASKLPVAGMAIGGVREIIEDENTGILVEAEDWEAMATKVADLLESPNRMKSMGEAARQRVEHHFNVFENTERTGNLLREIALAQNKKVHDVDNPDFSCRTKKHNVHAKTLTTKR